VASLTIPLRSLIDPVIVPGFGYAVIDREGEVLFHSDRQHSLIENFFDESDRSRRLRALVAAKHEEWVDIRYWGDEHRALVTPMKIALGAGPDSDVALVGEPWTLVTFYTDNLARTVASEWLVLILALALFYAGIYVVTCFAGLLLRPKYRVPWLWPDPARSRTYLDLVPMLLMLSAALAVSIAILTPGDLIRIACLVPFLGWLLTYSMLSPRLVGVRLGATVAIGVGLLVPLLAVIVQATSVRA